VGDSRRNGRKSNANSMGFRPEERVRQWAGASSRHSLLRRRRQSAGTSLATSHIERSNLTMRMSIGRFTRLTNAVSKKLEQHCAAIALHFASYNLCRPHSSVRTRYNNRVTPAMAAGLEKRQWKIEGLPTLLAPVKHKGGRPRTTPKPA